MSVMNRTVMFVVVMSFAVPAQAGIASKGIREAMKSRARKLMQMAEGAERLTAQDGAAQRTLWR